MMKKIKLILFLVVSTSFFIACFDDQDDVINPSTKTEIGNYIWRAMNNYYLYQSNVADLADDRFGSQEVLNNHIDTFNSPSTFFESLIYDRQTIDKYSWIVSDYEALEASFAGVNKTNGMVFGFFIDPDNSSNKAYGYVRYVNPNTDASSKGIERGMIFNRINGNEITYTVNNNSNQIDNTTITNLSQDSYEISLADFDGTNITPLNTSITLVKSNQATNPIRTTNIVTDGAHKIGYLLYNSFTANYDDELNNAFGSFVSEGITDLVLDLRYNPGGSVHSAITLASLITGQFNNQVFSTEEWNSKLQNQFSTDQLTNRFVSSTRNGASLNSLNLSKVYVLTTGRSASASELVIAGLRPYVDVVQIGTTTEGKFQASITLYDSPNYSKNHVGLNPGHKYAIQPLVLKSVNSVGFTDYSNGLSPSSMMELPEDYSNLGILGHENEPLFARAIADITGSGRFHMDEIQTNFQMIDYKQSSLENSMYKETID